LASPPPSVFLLDRDPSASSALSSLLESAGHRVESFTEEDALLARLTTHDRGCLVLDVRAPGPGGLALLGSIHARGVHLPVIFSDRGADVPTAVLAMKQGAVDFLSPPIQPGELLSAVDLALRRDATIAAELSAADRDRERWAALSPREREVCGLLAKGLINKQIAAALGTAEVTVQAQHARALRKLQVGSVAELVRLMDRIGAGDAANRPPLDPS
jgi:FixJ family two-component response regulator